MTKKQQKSELCTYIIGTQFSIIVGLALSHGMFKMGNIYIANEFYVSKLCFVADDAIKTMQPRRLQSNNSSEYKKIADFFSDD